MLFRSVFKEESPSQFTDTVELFDYGFNNFQVMNISENEDKYQMEVSGFLQTGNDIFGNSKPILSIDSDSYAIIPNTINFTDLDSSIDYSVSNDNCIAQIKYSYHDTYVGSAYLELATDNTSTYDFDTNIETTDVSVEKIEEKPSQPQGNTIFINVKKVLTGILIFAVAVILLFVIRAIIMNNNNARRRKNRVKRKQKRRERIRSSFDDFDF